MIGRVNSYNIFRNKPLFNVKGNSDKKVILKDGKAFDEEYNKFTGSIIHTDKNNNEWELRYCNGVLKSSLKNSQPYKTYYNDSIYNAGLYCDVRYINESRKFSDGTELKEIHYFPFKNESAKIIEDADSKVHLIIHNPKPIYKDEPVYVYTNSEDKRYFVLKSAQGKDNSEFTTKNQARKYFKNEYGIDIKIDSLKQARLLKLAVDTFADVNYRNRGKKLFDGLKVRMSSEENSKTIGYVASQYRIFKIRHPNADINELINNIILLNGMPILYLNKNFDWKNMENVRETDYRGNYHPSPKAKSSLEHELSHFIAITESPEASYNSSKLQHNEKDIKTVKKVSKYAVKNASEFIAEYIAGRLNGQEYDEDTTKLYKQYLGPDLFI